MKVSRILVFAFVVMCCVSAFGQKKDSRAALPPKGLSQEIIEKYKPIPLSTNIISGELQDKNSGKYHYYSFVAGRGEIIFTVSLESSPQASTNGIQFDLFDNNEQLLGFALAMSIPSMPYQKVTKIYIPSKQSVLLRITEGVNFGLGKYQIQVSGAVEIGQGSTAPESDPLLDAANAARRERRQRDKTVKLDCLPKQGTLIVKMKDGSKKIIDLSEAETVTIVP